MVVGTLLAALLLIATPAWAATWCVPSKSIRSSCPKVASTVQGAVNAAAAGDIIYVGPGNPAERIVVAKRVQLIGLPGHTIRDLGLASGDALLELRAGSSSTILNQLVLNVHTSASGLALRREVTQAKITRLTVVSTAEPRPAYGILVDGAARPQIQGVGSRVSGFDIGIGLLESAWHDVEKASLEQNGTGILVVHGKGQIFWNTFRGNEIGLHTQAIFHTDINSNTFDHNDVGLLVGLGATPHPETGLTINKNIEFNHNDFTGNTVAVNIEVTPGEFAPNYLQDPGVCTQWADLEIDGVVQPTFKTTGPC